NDLPDFAYFNHSIHVHAGVRCTTCHGPVDRMQLTYQGSSLHMQWCLDCHRNPTPHIGPRAEVTSTDYRKRAETMPDRDVYSLSKRFDDQRIRELTSSSTCHR